jgi:hypothetical protein
LVWREASKARRERDTAVSGERVDVRLWRFGGAEVWKRLCRHIDVRAWRSGLRSERSILRSMMRVVLYNIIVLEAEKLKK